MSNRFLAGGVLLLAALTFSACQAQSTSGDSRTGASSSGAAAGTPSGASSDTGSARGATSSSGAGTNASNSAPSGPNEKDTARGNTPPGVDRDGHGPATGAIVDPAGVTKK